MDLGRAYAIGIKDMREIFSSISIYGPMLGVPLFFAIMLPVLTFYVTEYSAPNIISKFVALPYSVPSLPTSGASGYLFMSFFTVSVLGPVFLTMPIFTAAVIAADSFSGEKERKTSESLLTTPVSVSELLLGKILASLVPTVLLTFAVFAIYGYTTNLLSNGLFGAGVLPTAPWLMMLFSSPLLALATIGIVVIVSSHVKSIKGAQQLSTLLVLPVLVMPFTSVLGLVNFTFNFFVYLMAFLVVLDVIVLYAGVRSFRKENIL